MSYRISNKYIYIYTVLYEVTSGGENRTCGGVKVQTVTLSAAVAL